MDAKTIWLEETRVKSSETDFQKRLKLSSFFRVMQDAASNHASHLGFGYDDLRTKEIGWILSRKKVRFYDFPLMDETVSVQTWPKGIQQKLFYMRDHQVYGSGGRHLASATSGYVLVSLKARRMVPPGAFAGVDLPDNGGLSALDELLEKIPAVETVDECFSLRAGYSDVDIMGHVTNARYIDWISDCFSMDEHRQHKPGWLQINYLNEIKAGESVSLLRGQRPEDAKSWYLCGMNRSNNTRAFEAELHWD